MSLKVTLYIYQYVLLPVHVYPQTEEYRPFVENFFLLRKFWD